MKSFFKLISGFFADQDGNGSRKAVGLYLGMYMLWMMVKASIDGKVVNEYILGAIVIIVLFCLGAITAEWITKNWNPKSDDPKQP
jgi:hypothetical protein